MRARRDWYWLGACLLVVIGAAAVSALRAPSSGQPLSVQNAGPAGALALDLWLRRLGYAVQRQQGRPVPAGVRTILVLSPTAALWQDGVAGTLAWVRSGGRLVVAADEGLGSPLLRALGVGVVPAGAGPVSVDQPLLLAPPTTLIDSQPGYVLQGTGWASVASSSEGPVVLARRTGRGEIWVLSLSGALSNAGIAQAENRRLALNLAGDRPGPIAFVEGHTASAATPTQAGWLVGTTWGLAVLMGLALLLGYRFLSGWRLGPPAQPLSERWRPSTEYVESLAALLRRTRGGDTALEIYQRHLRRALEERYGSEPETVKGAARGPVEALLAPGKPKSEEDLVDRVAAIVQCENAVRGRRDG